MMKTGLTLASTALALILALGAPAFAQDIDFGDNSSNWADDGACDDPRFEGPGTAPFLSPLDEMRDANDCQAAFDAGEITLAAPVSAPEPDAAGTVPANPSDIDFGDDSGVFANDGECDDPRFGGILDSHELTDATDCRTAYEAGEVTFADTQSAPEQSTSSGDIDFGDDSGSFANDGECDDPRFGGALTSHEMADATDCRSAYEAGEVTYAGDGDATVSSGDIDFGDDSGTFANDGECDDPRFGGALTSHEMADATDCRTAYEGGEVTYTGASDDGGAIETDIDFGDDSGNWANDGECDDPRFGGTLDSHEMADATDCRTAYDAGEVTYLGDGDATPAADIDFGDDSGVWANDGECDDPRFGGALDSHEMADATDCRTAYDAGEVTYVDGGQTGTTTMIDGIDFGTDTGTYAMDQECDDPRFTGSGMGAALDDHLMADATDCSTAYQAGTVTLAETTGNTDSFRINFGDDSGADAFDGICDDPRFQGRGAALELLDANMLTDASDCRTAYDAGTVTYNP